MFKDMDKINVFVRDFHDMKLLLTSKQICERIHREMEQFQQKGNSIINNLMNKISLFYHYNDCAFTFCVITLICLMFTNLLLHMLMLETCLPYNLYSSEFAFQWEIAKTLPYFNSP